MTASLSFSVGEPGTATLTRQPLQKQHARAFARWLANIAYSETVRVFTVDLDGKTHWTRWRVVRGRAGVTLFEMDRPRPWKHHGRRR